MKAILLTTESRVLFTNKFAYFKLIYKTEELLFQMCSTLTSSKAPVLDPPIPISSCYQFHIIAKRCSTLFGMESFMSWLSQPYYLLPQNIFVFLFSLPKSILPFLFISPLLQNLALTYILSIPIGFSLRLQTCLNFHCPEKQQNIVSNLLLKVLAPLLFFHHLFF